MCVVKPCLHILMYYETLFYLPYFFMCTCIMKHHFRTQAYDEALFYTNLVLFETLFSYSHALRRPVSSTLQSTGMRLRMMAIIIHTRRPVCGSVILLNPHVRMFALFQERGEMDAAREILKKAREAHPASLSIVLVRGMRPSLA